MCGAAIDDCNGRGEKFPSGVLAENGCESRDGKESEHSFPGAGQARAGRPMPPAVELVRFRQRSQIKMFSRMRLFFVLLAGCLCALEARADVLIFADGDRVQGTFVRRENGKIIFQSLRFGNLSVPEKEATVEVTSQPPPIVAPMPAEAPDETEAEEEVPPSLYDQILLTRFRRKVEEGIVRWWEPWSGRLAASTDIVNDASERRVFLAEGRVRRNWAKDEVRLETRYEYREENDVRTVDLIKGSGLWRHDLSPRFFASYRPLLERDKINSNGFQPFPYVLLQQQLGVGVHLLRKERVKLRAGVAENFFNVWSLDDDSKSADHIESVFFEAEASLPWRITITERGVWYYSIRNKDEGWENEFEFSKKLTDSLSLGVRHEFRQNNPDSRVQDYERLRFLIGYDF
jgi:hypothetical protein